MHMARLAHYTGNGCQCGGEKWEAHVRVINRGRKGSGGEQVGEERCEHGSTGEEDSDGREKNGEGKEEWLQRMERERKYAWLVVEG